LAASQISKFCRKRRYTYAEQSQIKSRKLGNRLEYRRSSLDRLKDQHDRPAHRSRADGVKSHRSQRRHQAMNFNGCSSQLRQRRPALATARDVPTQSRRSAGLDRCHHAQLATIEVAGIG
jgi:hypothetical protein